LIACGELSEVAPAAAGGGVGAPEVGLIACGDLSIFADCGGRLVCSVASLSAGS